jgi:hypothetical protein
VSPSPFFLFFLSFLLVLATYLLPVSSVMTRKQLVELCGAYHLPCSGNKPKLKAHLRAFSLDQKCWERYAPTALRLPSEPFVSDSTLIVLLSHSHTHPERSRAPMPSCSYSLTPSHPRPPAWATSLGPPSPVSFPAHGGITRVPNRCSSCRQNVRGTIGHLRKKRPCSNE